HRAPREKGGCPQPRPPSRHPPHAGDVRDAKDDADREHGADATGAKPPAMTAVTGVRDDRRASPLAVGVVVWLASELMFFAGLFAAYFTLRSAASTWPPVGVELATGRTAIATAVLVASSFTMHGAVKAAQRDDRRRAITWLGCTALLGVVFLSNQALEYAQADFRISSHAYGSAF